MVDKHACFATQFVIVASVVIWLFDVVSKHTALTTQGAHENLAMFHLLPHEYILRKVSQHRPQNAMLL